MPKALLILYTNCYKQVVLYELFFSLEKTLRELDKSPFQSCVIHEQLPFQQKESTIQLWLHLELRKIIIDSRVKFSTWKPKRLQKFLKNIVCSTYRTQSNQKAPSILTHQTLTCLIQQKETISNDILHFQSKIINYVKIFFASVGWYDNNMFFFSSRWYDVVPIIHRHLHGSMHELVPK